MECTHCGTREAQRECGHQCGTLYCGEACAEAHWPAHFERCEGRARWAKKSSKHLKEGAFTKQAKKHHESVREFESDVLDPAHKDKYSVTTRRRAQWLRNVSGK